MYDIYGTGNKEVTVLNIVGRALHSSPGVFKVALTDACAEESNELEEFVYPDAVAQAFAMAASFSFSVHGNDHKPSVFLFKGQEKLGEQAQVPNIERYNIPRKSLLRQK